MKLFFILNLILILESCAVSEETFTPNGKKGYTINCSGTALSWAECYAKAGKLCSTSGYKVIEKSSDKNSSLSANQYGLYGLESNSRSLLIECK
ncbi:MAG: hypothetical protein SFT90_05710 [Rickettsiales bacterium]|nr:hypothetical protein [Rickettsiales bacterium]